MITQKKIKELNFSDQKYIIPSYQRGYRWDSKQITELLDDLLEVYNTRQGKYCLQPVVVNTIEKDRKFEIIDGQQRLTTIFIILLKLSRFTDERFNLEFETRKNCESFFEGLNEGKYDYSNPDFAHISNAHKVVTDWFQDLKDRKINSTIEMNIFNTLMDNVEVIWYDIEQPSREESIKIFTRLNSGKIPLTTAELLKALFLSSANFPEGSLIKEQLDISNKWNQIEYQLQDDEFWSFINKEENHTATRIEYIFRLIAESEGVTIHENDDIFRHYYPKYIQNMQEKTQVFVEDNWNKVEFYFTILREWYYDEELYHLIGLLIWNGLEVNQLIIWYKTKDKEKFKYRLFKEIDERFCNVDFRTMNYKGTSYRDSFKTLVFFNVMESYQTKNRKLPFSRIKNTDTKWSLEHIHAQNADEVRQNEYKQWIEDHLKVVSVLNSGNTMDKLIEEIRDFLKEFEIKQPVELKDQFAVISAKIINAFSYEENKKDLGPRSKIEFEKLAEEHHISNLALLDTKSNSSLGKSVFAVKRNALIRMDYNGTYIPLATKNSFLKYYSDFPEHLNYWTLSDRDEYIGRMIEKVNFVKKQSKRYEDE